mmetsp:Transcript_9311/g.32826  ORF Transcript_9311/g.32826 Transcript_9311/m.32826 type:complete len:245 (-) Transcript_9311:444-1178(-)
MRPRNSSSGTSAVASRGEPSKGSTGPRFSCSTMTLRSHTFPELGSRTGSTMRWPISASWNSGGSFSPMLTAAPAPFFCLSNISFWCNGTNNRPCEIVPGRKRIATWIEKSLPSSAPTPSCPRSLLRGAPSGPSWVSLHLPRAGSNWSKNIIFQWPFDVSPPGPGPGHHNARSRASAKHAARQAVSPKQGSVPVRAMSAKSRERRPRRPMPSEPTERSSSGCKRTANLAPFGSGVWPAARPGGRA